MTIDTGHAVAPETPGLGIAWDRNAMDDRRVA
jgi:L-alanine-DL-glutamate epimerase-like enolase superfamily enzyme